VLLRRLEDARHRLTKALGEKVAIVTAGCAGLGLEIARALNAAGAAVIATTRDPATARARNDEWGDGRMVARVFDFSRRSREDLLAFSVERFDAAHVLINNAAGRFPARTVEEITSEDFRAELDASLVSALGCSQAAVAARSVTKTEAIVNIASIYGVLAVDHRIYQRPEQQTPLTYACSKAALVHMTRYLAAYWAPIGVRVNCVSPGGVKRDQPSELQARYSARVPMGRMVDADEVSAAVVFLASPASSGITGENILVDGGLHVW
jgi:NAD(P)-dependent dehydrogenase (short-subunit alcohol dehydrogenase family)